MNEDEKVFHKVCDILQRHNVNFWICHGTLLGIIRDGRLLPWDHDIDFAVWYSEVSKQEISKIFHSYGYRSEAVFGDMDCLHFYGKNKTIDISFYKINDGVASIKWVVPPSSTILIVYLYCVQVVWEGSDSDIRLSNNFFKRIVQIILNKVLLLLQFFVPNKVKKMLFEHAIKLLKYTGYSYSDSLMTFKKINYNNTSIQIPIDSEKCLEITYGPDWRVPKKNYIWYEEASNLTK